MRAWEMRNHRDLWWHVFEGYARIERLIRTRLSRTDK